MIEKGIFQIGKIDDGTKTHLMLNGPVWGNGPACGESYHTRHIGNDLTIHDVDCERCMRKLIYKDLLPEEEKQPENKLAEWLISIGSVERPFSTPQREIYKTPSLVFKSDEEIRCAFFALVVRTDALRDKYKGGVRAFVEKHRPRCNRQMAVLCWMSTGDLEEPLVDIEESGLIPGEDYECFDAMSKVRAFECLKRAGEDVDRERKFQAEWLRGYVHNGGVMIHYAGE